MKQIVIIGGGASGLVAAIMAARNGARVVVLERMQRVGKKLLATGNGRCNLSNRRVGPAHYHGARPEFVEGVFAQFGLEKTLHFFESLGVSALEEDEGALLEAAGEGGRLGADHEGPEGDCHEEDDEHDEAGYREGDLHAEACAPAPQLLRLRYLCLAGHGTS